MSLNGGDASRAAVESVVARTLSSLEPRTYRRSAAAAVARWAVSIVAMAAVFPLMVSRLGADGLGLWAVLTTPTSMMGLAGLGVAPASVVLLGRSVANALVAPALDDADCRLREGGRLCVAGMLLSALAAVVTVVAGWLCTAPLLGLLGIAGAGGDEALLFRSAVVCLAAMLIGSSLVAQLDAARRVDLSSVSWATVSVLNAGFLLVALLVAPGLRALALVQLATALAHIVVPLLLLVQSRIILLWRYLSFDGKSTLDLTRLAVGLGGAGALMAMIDPIVKVTLGATVGMVPVAAYELAQRVVRLAAGAFSSALQPLLAYLSGVVGEGRFDDVPAAVGQVLRPVASLAFPSLTALALGAAPVISVWLGSDAPPGTAASIALLCPVMAMNLMASPLNYALQGAGRGARVLSVQVANVAGVTAILLLVPADMIDADYIGAAAAAVGLFLSALVTAMHFGYVWGFTSVRRWLTSAQLGVGLAAFVVPWPVVARNLGLSDVGQVIVVTAAAGAAAAIALARGRPWRATQT